MVVPQLLPGKKPAIKKCCLNKESVDHLSGSLNGFSGELSGEFGQELQISDRKTDNQTMSGVKNRMRPVGTIHCCSFVG